MAWGSWISAWHTASDFRSGEILWKASIYCEVFWASREKMVSKLMLLSIWHASMEHVPYAGQSANVRGCAKVKVAGSWPSQSLWSRQRDVLGNGNSAQGTQVSAWTWGNTEGQRTENSREKRLGTSHPLTTLGDRIAPAEWAQLPEVENLVWKQASLSASSILISSLPDFTGPQETDEGNCWSSLGTGWKRISRPRAFWKGVSLLGTKSRDTVGTVSAVVWPPESRQFLRVSSPRQRTFLLEGWH